MTPSTDQKPDVSQSAETGSQPSAGLLQKLACPGVLLRLAFLLSTLVYIRTITFDWVFDDHLQVTMNPWLDSWGSLKQIFTLHSWAFSDYSMPAKFYRPMYLVWLLINNKLFHGVPGWFHLAALGLHLVVVYLAFLTARRLTRSDRVAAIATIFFALHPTKAESVAWIAGVTEVVVAAFFFGTVLAYLRWRQGDPREAKWLAISVACFAGAIFAKETAILAPILIVVYEWLQSPGERAKAILKLLVPYAGVGIVYWLIRVQVLKGIAELGGHLSISKTIYTVPATLWWYLWHTVWPFGLSLYYPELIVRSPSLTGFVLPLSGLIGLLIAFWFWARKCPVMLWAGLWYGLTLLPPALVVLMLQPHDRYLYLPTFGFAIILALLLDRLKPAMAGAVIAVIAIAFAVGTFITVGYWDSDLAIFERGARKAPDNMAVITLYAESLRESGQLEKGRAIMLDAFSRHPDSENLSYGIALGYFNDNDYPNAKKFFEHTIAVTTSARVQSMCHYHLGLMDLSQKQLDLAEREFRMAIALAPDSAGFHRALGNVLVAQGRKTEAETEFEAERQVQRTRTRNF